MADQTLVTHPDGWRSISPTPSPEALKAFYAQEYFQGSHGTYAQGYTDTEVRHRGLLAAQTLLAVERARGRSPAAGDSLLEIGCGEGWFLKAADAAGFAVRGLDYSEDGLRRFHPDYLDRVTCGDALENLDRLIDDGAAADVCVMEHVLEHVTDPEGLLARLPRLLRPGGVVAITVPNDFSALQLAARQGGLVDRDFWVAPPQHLNYFDSQSLPALMRRLGLDVRLAFASFPIDWYLMHPGSNYVADPAQGKPAHRARMAIDLLMAERGLDAFLDLGQALFGVGMGRSLTVVAAPKAA
ncbi:class I SAM-dependent methyltransferase [Caulobacter sp. KR2-114]|uniref:class I SAM-dependent methyltransferase n=1 Tax=Caulobacter sp. KR2-114 TaxID=3400912 RepID=UPI003C01CA19